MENYEGGHVPKLSSWLYSSRRASEFRRYAPGPSKWLNYEGGPAHRLLGSRGTDRKMASTSTQPAQSKLEKKSAGVEIFETFTAANALPKRQDPAEPGPTVDNAVEASPSQDPANSFTYRFRVSDNAWRETQPGKELFFGAGSQFYDFCDSPAKKWASGEPQPSILFGQPLNINALPVPRRFLPPRLFDLLYNRTVDTETFMEAHYNIFSHVWGSTYDIPGEEYGVSWPIPISSRAKLTGMLEFARFTGGERYVWIDILCMDQTRSNEDQVPRMKSYYTNASACLVWLEDSHNELEGSWANALNAISELNAILKLDPHSFPTMVPTDMLNGSFLDLNLQAGESYQLVQKVTALDAISWFKRVWTLQEGVIPDTLAFCTAEKYMFTSAHLFTVVSICAMIATQLLNYGDSGGLAILNSLQNSEIWKLFRLRQLYRKRQVSFWHIIQATKGRECSREQDRVFGVLGLAQGVSIPVDYNRPLGELLQSFFMEHLIRNDFGTLLFDSGSSSIAYSPSSHGFISSGAHASERRESHKIIPTGDGMIHLVDVGVDSVKKFWCLMGNGKFAEWSKLSGHIMDISISAATDVCKAWELDVESFPVELRSTLICTIWGFGVANEQLGLFFQQKSEDLLTAYLVAVRRAMITWSSVSTMPSDVNNCAYVVIWTSTGEPMLAVLSDIPQSQLLVVAPSSYVDEPGEGFLLVTKNPGDSCYKKIGVGVSDKVKPASLGTFTILS